MCPIGLMAWKGFLTFVCTRQKTVDRHNEPKHMTWTIWRARERCGRIVMLNQSDMTWTIWRSGARCGHIVISVHVSQHTRLDSTPWTCFRSVQPWDWLNLVKWVPEPFQFLGGKSNEEESWLPPFQYDIYCTHIHSICVHTLHTCKAANGMGLSLFLPIIWPTQKLTSCHHYWGTHMKLQTP